MKKTLIVANWKMHLNTHEASILIHQLDQHVRAHRSLEVVIAPSLMTLQPLSVQIDRQKFQLAAQNAYYKDEGAFTGEVSFNMLRDLVHYAIVGHSERRAHFIETLEVVRDKVAASVRNGIKPILCVGETQQERVDGEAQQVIHDQLVTALFRLTSEEIKDIVIAYEPVWAIGTGVAEDPADISKVIKWIRHNIAELYGRDTSNAVRILYGASVEPENVHAILSIEGVDGLLVGGASLIYTKFAAIIDNAYQLLHEQPGHNG